MARKTKKEQKFHEMEGTTEYPCEITFTPEELTEKRDRLVSCIKEAEDVTEEKKGVVADYNKQLSELHREQNQLCNDILKKSTNKTVTCKVKFNFDKGEKYVIHPQTGEVIKTAPIDLDDIRLKEEFEAGKHKKGPVNVTLALPPSENVIETTAQEVTNNDDDTNNMDNMDNGEVPF